MNDNLRYYIYARKSSESEDRQVQSIPAQIECLGKMATDNNLHIVETFTESASAKAPDQRPIFASMLDGILEGKADGILCWHINRLSRNPKDSGDLQWMLQRGQIKCIRTAEGIYLPGDNALMFSVQASMANQFIRDLSAVVQRGIQKKLQSGQKPGVAPVGYMNNRDEHTIESDPQRFGLVRKMWDMALTGNYTCAALYRIVTDDWGFITRKMGRLGNKSLAMSGFYKLFTNKFYAGVIVHNGKEWPGKHKPMITLEEFERVQCIFNTPGARRPHKHHEFPYTGMIRCAKCGGMYTAEEKLKMRKDGSVKRYIFYHCTRRKKGVECPKQKWVTEAELEAMIDNELSRITIKPIFLDLALKVLRESNENCIAAAHQITNTQRKRLDDVTHQLDVLTRMRYREQIDDDTFSREKDLLILERDRLTKQLEELNQNQDKWIAATERVFDFATHARERFNNGNFTMRREILRALGQNFLIEDGKLFLERYKWFEVIAKKYPAIETELARLEPQEIQAGSDKSPALNHVISDWQAWRESDPRLRFWRPTSYHYTTGL